MYKSFTKSLCQVKQPEELQMSEEDKVTDSRMELQCPEVGCTLGEDGGRYKTEKWDQKRALQLLNLHSRTIFARQSTAGHSTTTTWKWHWQWRSIKNYKWDYKIERCIPNVTLVLCREAWWNSCYYSWLQWGGVIRSYLGSSSQAIYYKPTYYYL